MVPAYRAQATLAATLRALIEDNGDSVERVVVVASPGDAGADIAAAMSASCPRIEVLRLPVRADAGSARNLGRARAGGSLLLFVDADCKPRAGSVAVLMATLRERKLAAVVPRLAGEGGGLCGWLRHVLEFKEAAGHGPPPPGWTPPSATFLCRMEIFDEVGGFPAMWPGEDLVFFSKLAAAGHEFAVEGNAVCVHTHPGGWGRMFRHQYRLGATSALARRLAVAPGKVFVEIPWLSPLLLFGRAWRGLRWFVRYRRLELPLLLAVSPLYIIALGVWTFGFSRAAVSGSYRRRLCESFSAVQPRGG